MKFPISALTRISSWQWFQLLRYGSVIATNILLTKNLLSAKEIGWVETLFLIGSIGSTFWVSGAMQGLLSTYRPKEKTSLLFNVWIAVTSISILSATAIGIWFYSDINNSISDISALLPWYLIFLIFNNPSFLSEYILMIRDENKKLIGYGIFSYSLQMIAMVLPLMLGTTLEVCFQLLAVLGILKFIFTTGIVFQLSVIAFNGSLFIQFIRTCIPLSGAILLSGYAPYIDGIIIRHFFDDATFAIFSYGARELPIALVLANAFSESYVKRITNEGPSSANLSLQDETKRLSMILFPLTGLLILLSPTLFPILFNDDFTASASIFNIYLLLLIPRMLFPQSVVIAKGKKHVILISATIELILNISISLLLLPVLGIEGVAWGTFIAYLADKLFLTWYVTKQMKQSVHCITHWKSWIVGSTVILMMYLITVFTL